MKLFFLYTLLLLTSCAPLQVPEFRGGESVKLEKVEDGKIKLKAGADIYNGNWFGIKIKPSEFDLYVEGEHIGKVHLDKKVKLKRKKVTSIEAPLTADLEKGSMLKLLRYASQENINIRLSGKAKAVVFIFSKKMDIDETATVPGAKLNLGI